MSRLLILATIFLFSLFSIASLTSAQLVKEINTPIGPITQGATVPVTWTLQTDAAGKMGTLIAQDNSTKNTIIIDQQVPLAPQSYMWSVEVPPGSYTLGLNDGTGLKQTAPVDVVQGNGAFATSKKSATASSAASSAAAPTASSHSTISGGGSAPDAANTPSTTPSSSASSISSGYNVIFALLGVTVAMVHL